MWMTWGQGVGARDGDWTRGQGDMGTGRLTKVQDKEARQGDGEEVYLFLNKIPKRIVVDSGIIHIHIFTLFQEADNAVSKRGKQNFYA